MLPLRVAHRGSKGRRTEEAPDQRQEIIKIRIKTRDEQCYAVKDLCKTFNIEGKSSDYNPSFSDISIFSNSTLIVDFF
jgi:hypothetical protein